MFSFAKEEKKRGQEVMKLPNAKISMEVNFNDKRIVLYEPTCHVYNNIYCLNKSGEVIWQVDRENVDKLIEFTWLKEEFEKFPLVNHQGEVCQYNPMGEIIAVDFWGRIYRLNPYTGIARVIGYER